MGLESQINELQEEVKRIYHPLPKQVILDRRVKPIDSPVGSQSIQMLVNPPAAAGLTDLPIWMSAVSVDIPFIIHNAFVLFEVVTDTLAPADLRVTFSAVLEGSSGSVFCELDRQTFTAGYRGPGDYRIPLLRNDSAMARQTRVRLFMTSTLPRTIEFRVYGELVSGPHV